MIDVTLRVCDVLFSSNFNGLTAFAGAQYNNGNGQAEGAGPAVPRAHRPHGLRPPGEVRAVHRALLGHREQRREVDEGKPRFF